MFFHYIQNRRELTEMPARAFCKEPIGVVDDVPTMSTWQLKRSDGHLLIAVRICNEVSLNPH